MVCSRTPLYWWFETNSEAVRSHSNEYWSPTRHRMEMGGFGSAAYITRLLGQAYTPCTTWQEGYSWSIHSLTHWSGCSSVHPLFSYKFEHRHSPHQTLLVLFRNGKQHMQVETEVSPIAKCSLNHSHKFHNAFQYLPWAEACTIEIQTHTHSLDYASELVNSSGLEHHLDDIHGFPNQWSSSSNECQLSPSVLGPLMPGPRNTLADCVEVGTWVALVSLTMCRDQFALGFGKLCRTGT